MNKANNPIGIIAGNGHLPQTVIEACLAIGQNIFVVALAHNTQQAASLANVPHIIVNIAAVGKAIQALKKNGVKAIVFAGDVKRPKWSELRPDSTGIKLLSKIKNHSGKGDDALLSTIVAFFEAEGFEVIGVDTLVKDLTVPHGTLGKYEPDSQALTDIELGTKTLTALGALDVGQSTIVQQGIVLGIEGLEGTDRLIERCAALAQEGKGGVLVKRKKYAQEHRIDLPTIGPDTIENAHHFGLRGIAVQAGSTLIVEHALVIKKINEYKMFLVGIT